MCSLQIVLSGSSKSLLRSLSSVFRMASPAQKRLASSFMYDKAYINGEWVSAKSGSTFEVINPANGKVIGSVPDMNTEDTELAVQKAYTAFQTWRETTTRERSNIMKKWFNLVMENHEELSKLITTEMGKPLSDARAEMTYGASFLEWFAEECRRTYGDVAPTAIAGKRMVFIKQPAGVAGLICPWNFPNAMITRKAAAAIAAGCSCVIKPAEDTPFSALALCELAEQAGLPPGVMNVVTASRNNTPAVGKTLCEHPLVATISFTGSTPVGKILLKQSADTVKKVSLELGGCAPFIVFDTADLSKAVAGAMNSKFRCSGQTCVCSNRFLVQEGIHDRFVEELEKAISVMEVGDGLDPKTTQGPLINEKAVEKVDQQVKDAISQGASVLLGGKRPKREGTFYEPTLITNVTTEMECAKYETFGPLAPILKFKTEEEALFISNNTSSGLAAYIYSGDPSQCWKVAEKLEYGIVGINEGLFSAPEAPFGGFKESGIGREGSKFGMDEFMEVKYMCFGV